MDDNGFLSDPEITFGGAQWSNADALTIEDLRHCRYVVLLGEPGMGKSTFLAEAQPLLPENSEAADDHHNLAEFGSEDRLVRSVFESRRVEEWLTGSGELCLTLDGFDDAQTRIPHLGSLVAGYLGRWPVDRLWLRIACRTSDWPQTLAGELPRLTPESKIVELLPLRRIDIAAMATTHEVDPELFLTEVEARGVGVLAARSLTLTFLLRTYAKNGRRLLQRAGDLYRDNLLAMCDEHNPARRTASPRPASPGDLYAIARRVAAASVFAGKTAVWLGPLPYPTSEDLIAADDLAGGSEPRGGGDSVAVTPSLVREVTRTPLFSGHGETRMGWAHTTFQDFLAADWLLANELPDHQVRSLLLADDGGVRPQVRRVAAWTVALAPDQFRWLTDTDPESFVGEIDIPDPHLRQVLVDRLLAASVTEQLLGRFARYSGLSHPGLANQLAPALAEPGPARWLAIRLATGCDVTECDQALAAIALDVEAPMHERRAAGAALAWHKRAGDMLLPLVLEEELRCGDDGHELLGVGLLASWPHALSTAQALDAVTEVATRNRRASFGGLVDELLHALTADDLEAAAAWLIKHVDTEGDRVVARVRNACLKLCTNHLHDPAAAAAAVAATKAQLLQHERVLTDGESFPDDVRRQLALLVARAADTDTDADLLAMIVCDSGALLSADDFLWLLNLANTDPTQDTAIHRLLPRLVDPTRVDHANAVLNIDQTSPLHPALSSWLDTCDLTDPTVIEIRANWQRMRERQTRRMEPQVDIDERIVTQLDNFERGDPNGYWIAARLVCVRPGTNRYHEEYQPDLTEHPRWERLAPSVRDRLVALAPRYLTEGRCTPEEWLGKERTYYPAQAAYRAMLLLLRLNPTALDTFPPTVWQEWAPIIIEWPILTAGAQPHDKERLLRYALPHAREQLRTALITVIDDTIRTGKTHWTRTECDLLWDNHLQQELTHRLTGQLPDDARTELATTLIRNAPDAAQPMLISWLDHEPERSRLAATLLLNHRAAQAWPAINHWLHSHPDDAENVFLDQAHHRDISPHLPVDILADLYLWLWDHFPPDDDPHDDEAHWVSPRESVGRFRDYLLERLRLTGTTESLAAIRRIVHTHPEASWLNRVYTAARAVHREATWQPTPPRQLRLLTENSRRRLVRTEKELLDAVTAALATIQRRLVGETPESHLLWNTIPQRRPKSEDEISDYLRNRLTDELAPHYAVVNREVQVRRNTPSGIGERTDLRIEALTPDGDPITVVIEVKTAWNNEVTTNLPTQLVDQYMHDIGTTAGIYLVLWTSPESWPADKVKAIDKAALTKHLDQQANEQTDHGRDVRVVHLDISYLRPQDLRLPD